MKKILTLTLAIMLAAPVAAFAQMPSSLKDIHGFVEAAYGAKFTDDTTRHDDYNMAELRLQLKTSWYIEGDNYLADTASVINVKADFTADAYFAGKTEADLRDLNFSFSPTDIVDVKIGRQVLTWGTGDYLFINDMFPKDYISFYIGRQDEYLKKPSDAVKVSVFPEWFNLNLVWIPVFEPNTMPDGKRLSSFDMFTGQIAGNDTAVNYAEPATQFDNSEFAARIYKNFGSTQAALYYFHGFDKMPRKVTNMATSELGYPKVDVYGASLQGPVLGGIGNIEFGYVDSREDKNGTNPLVENSMLRAMAGYAYDLGNDLTISFQYQFEQRLDYSNYEKNLPAGMPRFDQYRHLLTNRISKMFLNQTLVVQLFTFYSPSDDDGYFRASVSYKITDRWETTAGTNMPWGKDDYTEFGQMKHNRNAYLTARYSF